MSENRIPLFGNTLSEKKTATGDLPPVAGEFVDRKETAATAFKPKLWTYAAASPTIVFEEVPFRLTPAAL